MALTSIGPEHHCPDCKHILNSATSVNCNNKPKAGDITICIYCGCIGCYDEDFQLQKVREEDLDGIDKLDAEGREAVRRTQKMVFDLIDAKSRGDGVVWN